MLSRTLNIPAVLVTVLVLTAVLASTASAVQVVLPHTFVDGTVALASQVNENFGTLAAESNAQDLRIAALEGGVDLQFAYGQGQAHPGDAGDLFLMISVTSSDGPVTGLSVSDFDLYNPVVPAGGSVISVQSIISLSYDGSYLARIAPGTTSGTWHTGEYLFFFRVNTANGTDLKPGKFVIVP